MNNPTTRATAFVSPHDKQDETHERYENGNAPPLDKQDEERAERGQRNEADGNGASKRIHMRQVIDNIDKRLLKTFSLFYLRI